MITIDNQIPAGNIVFERMEGDDVYVHQELRDTPVHWFYWAMRVRGAEGRTLRFHFTNPPSVGVRGPVVSHDGGKTFSYEDESRYVSDKEFSHVFKEDEDEVWFYECWPYVLENWKSFVAQLRVPAGVKCEELVACESRVTKSPVPLLHLGTGKAPKRMLLSARHHCSETMASFVLEGIVSSFAADDELGAALRASLDLYVVPFTDYDGAMAGDQGKSRAPHDHNRDYSEFLYPETKAIADLLSSPGAPWHFFFDVHCPWLYRGCNEYVFTPQKDPATLHDVEAEAAFSREIEQTQSGAMAYRSEDDLPFGKDWNKGTNYANGLSSIQWALNNIPSLRICRTFEIPFANAHGVTVTPDTCRAFGRDIARALPKFV